jgi:flagellum-specific peptidoglycan hydrolase FlgJ
MNQYGIPASIKLAQAILESGNGNSYLAREANNHFGIKCGGVWNGKSISRADDNPNDCFRVYADPEASFRDHSQFLLRKRYEQLFT